MKKIILNMFAVVLLQNVALCNAHDLFSVFDKEGNGLIDSNDLFNLIKSAGLSSHNDRKLRKKIDQADTDGNGGLDKTEFIKLLSNIRHGGSPTESDFAFKKFDKNGDGIISKWEYKRKMKAIFVQLGNDITNKDLNKSFKEIDANQDGHISQEEFANIDNMSQLSQRGCGGGTIYMLM